MVRKRNKPSYIIEDDVMFEIFLRIPSIEVFKYRLVSKQWLSILSNPIFVSRWMTINNFTPWTTVIHESSLSTDEYLTASSLAKYSRFISGNDGFSLKFIKSKVLPEKLYVLSSCNGLVLCATTKSWHTKYYVCNPLMKTWVLLPRPPTYKVVVLTGLICEASIRSSFKVVCIPQFSKPKTKFSLEIFSSELGKWNTFEVSCSKEVTMPKCLQSRSNIIEHNGVLYWIEGRENSIIALDVVNNKCQDTVTDQCRLISLPKEVKEGGERFLAKLDGFVVCFHGEKDQLNCWVLEDDTNNKWVCRYESIPKFDHRYNVFLRPLAFDSVTQNIVIMRAAPLVTISTFNLRTKRLLYSVEVANNAINNIDFLRAFVFTPSPTPL